jgi:long-subunit acyl-CoA synthetase (AMP-forming)
MGAVSVLMNSWLPLEPLLHCLVKTTCTLVLVDPERADILSSSIAKLKAKFSVIEYEGKSAWPGMDIWNLQMQGYSGNVQQMLKDDPQIVPEDDATIIFTSGTSGLPSEQFYPLLRFDKGIHYFQRVC